MGSLCWILSTRKAKPSRGVPGPQRFWDKRQDKGLFLFLGVLPIGDELIDGVAGRFAGLALDLGAKVDLHQGKGGQGRVVALAPGFVVQPLVFVDATLEPDDPRLEDIMGPGKVLGGHQCRVAHRFRAEGLAGVLDDVAGILVEPPDFAF